MTQQHRLFHPTLWRLGFTCFAVCMAGFLLSGCHFPKTPNPALPRETSASVTEPNSPEAVWTAMNAKLLIGKINEAVQYFSITSAEEYRQAFKAMRRDEIVATMNKTIKKMAIEEDAAQYFFEDVISGETITFPVEFVKENGVWKILQF